MPAISCRSRPNSDFCMTSKPSEYACMRPYSMPLCTIFTKWPAPDGPTCAYPPSGARVRNAGSTTATAASSPPTIRQYPTSRPQMPPETPASTKLMPACFACSCRRCESWKFELPPSTTMSPSSSRLSSSWNAPSVGGPAGIISQTTRGASSWSTSSCSVLAVPPPERAYVFTSCPFSSSRITMFPPIRPRPTIPSFIPPPFSPCNRLLLGIDAPRVAPAPPCNSLLLGELGSRDVLEADADDAPVALPKRFVVAFGLRCDQPAEAERLAGDLELLTEVVDDLDEEAGIRAA